MKNTQLFSLALLSSSALLLTSGCTTVNSVENAQPVAQRQMVSDKRIITDGSLNNSVRVLSINKDDAPGHFMRIQVEIQNVTRSQKRFSYKIEWFDEYGILIKLPTDHTTPVSIEGKEVMSLVATAPTALARDFRVKFIEPVN